jgi:hypothetical protein
MSAPLNRQQRRAVARRRGYAKSEDCPCCNIKRIVTTLWPNNLRHHDGSALPYDPDGTQSIAIADFGVLVIEQLIEPGDADDWIRVTEFGETVMTMGARSSGSKFKLEREGKWIATLTAIREQLEARFGPVDLDVWHTTTTAH